MGGHSDEWQGPPIAKVTKNRKEKVATLGRPFFQNVLLMMEGAQRGTENRGAEKGEQRF